MSQIRSKDTKPEKRVRSLLHAMGYRFRLHKKDLPGCPDIVMPKYKAAIFVHGCFWHRHKNCKLATVPKTNAKFWNDKFKNNIKRDKLAIDNLKKLGWNVIIVWECQTTKSKQLKSILINKIHKLK